MTDPWLSGLIACALHQDAEAVRAALHARGLKTRSVPAGRAKEAWTCVTDRGTLALIVTGKGPDAARNAASFWMPRARWLVLAGAGPGTGMAPPGTVVLDGDQELAVLAARGAPQGTHTEAANLATVEEVVRSEAARQTLQNAGYAAWIPHKDAWQHAVRAARGVMLICHAITPTQDDGKGLVDTVPEGASGRQWWQTVASTLRPALRRAEQSRANEHKQAIQRAAPCAVAALLGPKP